MVYIGPLNAQCGDKKKQFKKATRLSEEALEIAEERIDKREKEKNISN